MANSLGIVRRADEVRYVELVINKADGVVKPKFTDGEYSIADTPDSFEDAGYIITADEVIIDIDDVPKDLIRQMIKIFKIQTETVWTDRGVHFYFKKCPNYAEKRAALKQVCALGFGVEHKKQGKGKKAEGFPFSVTVKRGGVLREVEHPGERQMLPDIFDFNKQVDSMYGMEHGGRNNALFQLSGHLRRYDDRRRMMILHFVNNHVFAEPLGEREFETVTREGRGSNRAITCFEIAEEIMQEYQTRVWDGRLYARIEGEYVCEVGKGEGDQCPLIRNIIWRKLVDSGIDRLKETRYASEIKNQLKQRSVKIPIDTVFPIKLKNGILKDGQFIPVPSYCEFTPYLINVEYDPDAEPVQIVDDFMNHLCKNNFPQYEDDIENYKAVVFEIMGHLLIRDPEVKRLIGRFFNFAGDGFNGKGTLMTTIEAILGSENVSAFSLDQMIDERYVYTMARKLVNLCEDLPNTPINHDHSRFLKNVATCDKQGLRMLYQQGEMGMIATSLIFTTNHHPKSFEKGEGLRRRAMWCPMYNKVDRNNIDPKFITKLTEQKARKYWFKRIVEGYQRLYENCAFTHCQIIEDYTDLYNKKNDPSIIWVSSLERKDIEGLRPPAVWQEYEAWYKENISDDGKGALRKTLDENIFKRFKDEGLYIGTMRVGSEKKPSQVYKFKD